MTNPNDTIPASNSADESTPSSALSPDSSLIPHPSSFSSSDLPIDPAAFYRAGQIPIMIPAEQPAVSALDRLGSCPIPKYKFPLLGFLATVYEHVSAHAATVIGR